MVKHALIMAASVCALAVGVASNSGSEDPQAADDDAVTEEAAPPKPAPASQNIEYEVEDYSEFKFGEPVVYTEENSQLPRNQGAEDEENDEVAGNAAIQPAAAPQVTSAPVITSPVNRVSSSSIDRKPRVIVKPGDPGSRENPISAAGGDTEPDSSD